jgi:eukaryotic-like serine/threonine-protein kinase
VPKVKLLDPADARRHLDRYELIGELASGGMATVFLARLAGVGGFQRFVAIKRLHPHLASEQEFVEMFLDEARLAAGIHHPHVVPILEVGMTGAADPAESRHGGFYLVMEYIEGDTLARFVSRARSGGGRVPRPVVVRVLLDALAGLHAAHELTDSEGRPVHLVHRDCSPQNLLVGADGCSRITDFGVARATSRIASTRSDRLKGKLAYMAPEQVRGGELDRRADVFAMGIVLWEALSGRRLFKAETEAATLSRVVLEPIPRLCDVVPDAPAAFDAVCAKALDREPSGRYQSAAEMAEALERAARASAGGSDAGVASPREVAGYVQALLGEELAAQREGVRVWLQSEPGAADARSRPSFAPLQKASASRAGGAATASRAGAEDATLTAQGSFGADSWAPCPALPSSGEVIPVDLPPDPRPQEDDALAAREASLTGVLAFSRRPSVAPSSLSVPPAARRRGRLAGVLVAAALLGGGLLFWTVQRPRAAASRDGVAAPGQAGQGVAPVPQRAAEPGAALSEPSAASSAAEASAPTPAGVSEAPEPRPAGASTASRSTPAAGPGKAVKKASPAAPADDLANPYR